MLWTVYKKRHQHVAIKHKDSESWDKSLTVTDTTQYTYTPINISWTFTLTKPYNLHHGPKILGYKGFNQGGWKIWKGKASIWEGTGKWPMFENFNIKLPDIGVFLIILNIISYLFKS